MASHNTTQTYDTQKKKKKMPCFLWQQMFQREPTTSGGVEQTNKETNKQTDKQTYQAGKKYPSTRRPQSKSLLGSRGGFSRRTPTVRVVKMQRRGILHNAEHPRRSQPVATSSRLDAPRCSTFISYSHTYTIVDTQPYVPIIQ